MASPSEKLAQSLEVLKELQDNGITVFQTKDLSRTHRERLMKNGFLKEAIKGWYILSSYRERPVDSTSWYASFWKFAAIYLHQKFKDAWCLSPEQSLSLHSENWTVPDQLLVRSPKGNNRVIAFPHNTSIFDVKYKMPSKNEIQILQGLRVFSVSASLIACSPRFFIQNSIDVKTALLCIRDASELLHLLLLNGQSVVAGRLAGAFRDIGRDKIADDILSAMHAADYQVREYNPFETSPVKLPARDKSPYVDRMRIAWQSMREVVLKNFPKPPTKKTNTKIYLKKVAAAYVMDAYHSLSIEGYYVSPELLERVRSGKWNPHEDENDREQVAALAARGYWLAFQCVEKSLRKVLDGKNPGKVFDKDHGDWYREMFSPSVIAGILKSEDLAGYRRHQVYIRGSQHVPPNVDAVLDLMSAFCDLLSDETEPAVRVVLGHFFFVNIHPYMDGNGRMGRFLMNLMFAAGGYPWLVIPVESRDQYMNALEAASTKQSIKPFTQFLAKLMKDKNKLNTKTQ